MKSILLAVAACLLSTAVWSQSALVFQSDFGTRDAAVASMKGVAVGVSAELRIYDVTHEIPVFNIWEAALRLEQTAEYWPRGTVFVSVVDPGVGTVRRSVVLKTRSGHYFVTPDNGTLTFVAKRLGIEAVREIDEAVNRLQNSETSYTFHGRDVFAYTGARLAAGVISYEEVGRELPRRVVTIPYQEPEYADGVLRGNIPILDVQYGNVWTNIDRSTFQKLQLKIGEKARIRISKGQNAVLDSVIPYFATFGDAELGEAMVYLNSLNNVALAINQGSFAEVFKIESGPEWNIQITR